MVSRTYWPGFQYPFVVYMCLCSMFTPSSMFTTILIVFSFVSAEPQNASGRLCSSRVKRSRGVMESYIVCSAEVPLALLWGEEITQQVEESCVAEWGDSACHTQNLLMPFSRHT